MYFVRVGSSELGRSMEGPQMLIWKNMYFTQMFTRRQRTRGDFQDALRADPSLLKLLFNLEGGGGHPSSLLVLALFLKVF